MASKDDDFLIVAAIDFGTTFSGYAFSFISTPSDPRRHENIRINKSWGASLGFQSYKSPTSVLIEKSGKFLKFGYEAEQVYSQALEDEDSDDKDGASSGRNLLLFRHFKMMLFNRKDVKLKSMISAVDGTIWPALDIFAHSIQYLKGHLLNAIKLETGSMPHDRIRWVITVPAIWGETAKQFMREASRKAGCTLDKDSRKLVIALEPEAASLCCRRLNLAQYSNDKGIGFKKGTKFLILDCGGGTTDITAHVMETDEEVKELRSASGGPWGGTHVDEKFIEFIGSIFGKNFLNHYRQKCPYEWLQFLTSFEKIKKSFKPDGKSKLCLALPWGMATVYSQINKGKQIEKVLKSAQGISFASGTMVIKNEVARVFFDSVVQNIVAHLRDLLRNSKLRDIKYILMVGGFSECQVLQEAVKAEFERHETKVLIPSEPQLAVIKGAVLFGHKPEEISARIARYTYGASFETYFDPTCHDVSKRYINEEGDYMVAFLKVFIPKGEEVKVGKQIRQYGCYPEGHQREIDSSDILMTDQTIQPGQIKYVDEPDVIKLGSVTMDVRRARMIEIIFTVGATEIQVETLDKNSGKNTGTKIDLLS